jgi:hypothetical protein
MSGGRYAPASGNHRVGFSQKFQPEQIRRTYCPGTRKNCREERNFRVLRIQRSAVTRIQQSLEISNVSSEWKTEYGARIASTIREILARSFVPA